MALNFGGGSTGTAGPLAGGIAGALSPYTGPAPSLVPQYSSFNPNTGTTTFQSALETSLGIASQFGPEQGESYYIYGEYRRPQDNFEKAFLGGAPPDARVENGVIYIPASRSDSPLSQINNPGLPLSPTFGSLISGEARKRKGEIGSSEFEEIDPWAFDPWWELNHGGLVRKGDRMKGYNQGGIASLQPGGAESLPVENPQQGMEELINAALMAIDPNSGMPAEDRQAIISYFEEVFGEGSIAQLKEEFMGTDEVPAMLTPGEVVVPKNKVLQAGNGNTEVGAQNIMQVIDEMNQLRGGEPAQALGGVGGIASLLGGGR